MTYLDELHRRLDRAFGLVLKADECKSILDGLLGYAQMQKSYRITLPPPPPFSNIEVSKKKEQTKEAISVDAFGSVIGQRIKEQRKKLGLTQQDLATRTGIRRPNIARLEKGDGLPNLSTLLKVAEGLNIEISSLI